MSLACFWGFSLQRSSCFCHHLLLFFLADLFSDYFSTTPLFSVFLRISQMCCFSLTQLWSSCRFILFFTHECSFYKQNPGEKYSDLLWILTVLTCSNISDQLKRCSVLCSLRLHDIKILNCRLVFSFGSSNQMSCSNTFEGHGGYMWTLAFRTHRQAFFFLHSVFRFNDIYCLNLSKSFLATNPGPVPETWQRQLGILVPSFCTLK